MADRSQTKPLKNRSDPYLPTLFNTPYAQSYLQLAAWTNPLVPPTGELQQRARTVTKHDMSSRLISLDQNYSRNHSQPLRNTSARSLIQNYEIVKRRYMAQAHGRIRIHEQSATNILPRVQINRERPARVTSAYQKPSKMNQNLSDSDEQDTRIESSNQSNVSIEERLACEITVSYASTTTVPAEISSREEIIVMQRHSTGETSLVYRGYLTKGETFSFKSQRRPTSGLSLAFYVQGLIDSVTSECCEFKCVQRNSNDNDQKQFLFKDIQKANPCERCRKDYADQLLMNSNKNTLVVHRNKKSSKNHHESNNIGKPSSTDAHIEGSKHAQKKKTSKYKSPKAADMSNVHYTETMATANPNLLEPDKSAESTTIQSSLIDTKETVIVPTIQATDQTLTEKCEDNPQVPNETETATTASDGIDLGQLMQKLTAYFKQNMKTSTQQTQSSRMPRHPKSVENFCYIMENHVPISNEEQQTLRGLINFGFIFDDINSKKSIEFLKKILKERLILILSKTSMENLSKPIQDEPLLSAIYVIDSSEENSFDSKFYRGSFSNITSLCKKLENDLQLLTYDLTSISSIPADYAGMSTLNYVQALIDILLETNEKRNLKKEMIDFCREEYADNIIQLKLIEEFENDFKPDDAIHWYLRHDAFLYKMMTRAFRVLDPDILFKLRYFIQHLYCQLKSSIDTSALTVHRTLRIRKDLLDKMKRHQGGLLSFNEFLLANKTQSAIEPSSTNIDSKLVRFQIGLGTGVSRHDVATKLNEVILTVGTIFRVDKIEPIDDGTFTVELTTNDEILKSGHLVTKSLRDAVHASFPLVRMVKLMKQKELTGYMEYFCSMLIDDPETVKDDATNLTLGGLLHSMGSYYYERKQYREALNHLQNALKVYLRVLPDDDVRLTPTYNNIGSVYNKQGLNEQALEYHRKAYEIQKNSPNPDMESVAAYVGNIGSVLIKLGRHKDAATYLELDLKIKQRLHPDNDHADVAAKYHNLAAAQFRLHQYSEALENYQKCLDIELKCHSDENPTVALTYYNMATTLEQLGQLQEAKEAVQKAIARLLLTKQPDDEDLQMQTKYLERLEKKIWMKNQLLRFRFQLRMTSVRLSRRREPANLRSSIILDSGTIFNQFEQALPIHEERRPIENKTRYPNLPDWHHRLPKSAKKKTHSPESSVTALSISQLQPSIENINCSRKIWVPNRYRISSVVPSRVSWSNQNQHRIEPTYPESIFIGPRTLDRQCSCLITMRYRSDPTLRSMAHNSRRDEVTILQVAGNGSTWIVFKGFVKMHDSFTFKSQRSIDDRFCLKLEINGNLDTTISACCERLYRNGGRIDDGDSSFWIETVEQYTPCAKCKDSIDLPQAPDDEKMIPTTSATSEESEADEDQSVASEKSTEKSKPSEVKYTLPSKPSMDLPSSSSSTDAKKVPDTPAIAPTIQSPLLQPPISHQPQVVAVPSPPPPSLSTVHKSTTQQDPPVSFSKIQVEPAINESTLFKYVSDVMQQALSKPKLRQTISPRRIGNVEDFTILYINHDEDKDLSLLHSTVNSIRTISDSSTLGTLLSACTDEKFIVVMSINQAEVVLSELQQYKCIQSIYLLSKQSHPPESINGYGNAIEIYRNIESVCDHLIKALRHIPARVIPMEITSKDSVSDLPFTYCQLLKETILCHDDESDLRKDMLTFCRTHYTHNQDEVHVINEYEKSFIDTHSIQWYTRHCFLTKILSRAFRTQEIDLLFKMRYFIQCLHKQIQSIAIKEPITAYAILDVEQEIMQKFLGNINGLVLFRSFLPATFARPTSTEYQNKDTQRYLIFSIRLGPDCAANIEQLRSSDCKIDVLINIDTVFRVVSIDEGENEVHTVNLESVSLNDSHFQQLTESLRKQIKTSVVILQLAKLLVQTDHYWEGDYLTESIYQDKSFEGDGTLLAGLAAAHHLLGNVDDAKRDFEAARYQFFKSLRAFQLFLPYNHSLLSSSYNNIGSMFYQDDHHECAIKFHEMALECQLKASSPDMDAVATYSGNIGAVYVDQKNYAAATKHLERAAMILEKMPTKDNPTRLISIFQKISSCFWRTDEPKKALEYYKKTLDIQLKLINPLPHPLSVTYYNLSTAYARIGDYDEAVVCAEKSVEYLRMISENHPELKENQAQLEIVRQKQWLKQVLST
ncbi:unnamed protein product [Rotaria socialis]